MREREVSRVVALLRSGRSVCIRGRWGSGVSSVLRTAERELHRRGVELFVVRGSAELSTVSYGALRFSMGGLFRDGADAATVVDRLTLSLGTTSTQLIVVEDADCLDALSVHTLGEVEQRLKIPLLATLSTRSARLPAALSPASLALVELDALTYAQLEAHLAEHAGGEVDPRVISRIFIDAAGNPRLSGALFDSGRDVGAISLVDDTWTLLADDLWSPDLIPVIDQYVDELSSSARECLRHVALSPCVRVADLVARYSVDVVDELDNAGLIALDPRHPNDAAVSIAVPVVAAHLTSGFRSVIVRSLDSEPQPDPLRYAPATIAQHVEEAARERADRAASAFQLRPSAIHLTEHIRAAWAAGRPLDAGLEYSLPAELRDRADAEAHIFWARYLLATGRGTGEVTARLRGLAASHPRFATLIDAHLLAIEASTGAVPHELDERVDAALRDLEPVAGSTVPALLAYVVLRAGMPQRALAIVELATGGDSEAQHLAALTTGLAQLMVGDAARARREGEIQLNLARAQVDRDGIHAAASLLAMCHLIRGSDDRARAHLDETRPLGSPGLLLASSRRSVDMLHAVLLASDARGNPAERGVGSPAALTSARRSAGADTAFDRLLGHLAHRDVDALATALCAAAERSDPYGAHYLRATALAVAPTADTWERARPDIHRTELTGYAQFVAFVREVIDGDPERIAHAADAYRDDAYAYLAYVAVIRATEQLTGWGELLHAAAERMRTRMHLPAGETAFAAIPDSSALSAREEEVAFLAGHLSNARIAERLGISKRTVDHHVSNALRKTGAADRYELSRLVTERGLTEAGAPGAFGVGA